MIIQKAFLTALAGFSLCIADISGIVTDTSGILPLSGAAVRLEKGVQTATTGADGRFILAVNTGISRSQDNRFLRSGPRAATHNGLLMVNVAEKSAVELAVFNLCGKTLSTARRMMDAGTYYLTPPRFGAGIYLYKIKSGSNEIVLKSNSFSQGGGVSDLWGSLTKNAVANHTKATAAINDVIAVNKAGFLNYREIITNSDTSGMVIKMIASEGTVEDADGNVYQTVKIGTQIWMAENLRATKYNDGSAIPFDTSQANWANEKAPKYCYYGNTMDADSIKRYGALYNWDVVTTGNPKKIAPTGWRVPYGAEWEILRNHLISYGYNWDGTFTDNKVAKSMAAKTDWEASTEQGATGCDLSINNGSGFSAMPSGIRDRGGFVSQGRGCRWWTAQAIDASFAVYCGLNFDYGDLQFSQNYQNCGASVRLLRD